MLPVLGKLRPTHMPPTKHDDEAEEDLEDGDYGEESDEYDIQVSISCSVESGLAIMRLSSGGR